MPDVKLLLKLFRVIIEPRKIVLFCNIQNNHCSPPRAMLLGGKTNQILTRELAGTQEM